MIPRLKELFIKEIKPQLKTKFEYKNEYMVPEIKKIILNMGLGLDGNDNKIIKVCEEDLSKIAGQKPVITKFKKSISNFKTRKNTNAGIKVTLRKNKMYEFLDRFINIALPRVRDFRGVNIKSFDGNGNYALGLKEQYVFPEIEYDNVDSARGMDIIFVTSAKSDEEARELLIGFDFPFNE